MSVYSVGRKSFISQRSTSSKRPRDFNRIKLKDDLKKLLQNFQNHKQSDVYEDLVCKIRDNGLEIEDNDLIQLLKEARGCISLLDRNVHLFVKVLLVQRWSHRSKELAEEYKGFLIDLCTAHNYYTSFCMDQLVNLFKPLDDEPVWEDGVPTATDKLSYKRIHAVLKHLLRFMPMSSELLHNSIVSNYPFMKRGAHEHECFVHNLLLILEYQPSLRRDILTLIVTRLIALDTSAPRREIEEMELALEEMDDGMFDEGERENWKSTRHPEAHTLDICMDIVFRFLENDVLDKNGVLVWDRTKALFSDLIFVFENIILPTFSLHHVQFLLFKFVSLKPTLYNMLIQFLWNKVMNPSVSSIIRQASVCYIASLLSRANFIPLGVLKEVMSNIASWIHTYIASQDLENTNPNMFVHGVFYSTCQALFYLVAFRHKDLVETKRDIVFLRSLNLSKVVTCQLNPLRVCLPQIVSNFASVTRTYQLAYCYTIIEHNSRNIIPIIYRDSSGVMTTSDQAYLDTFFPFDPYLLQRSSSHITPLYRAYDGISSEEKEACLKVKDDEDDFLMDTSATSLPHSFSYGSSPGFHL